MAEKTEAVAETMPDPYELEEIFIPRAGAKEDPNLFVSVNGKNFLIPKGKKSRCRATSPTRSAGLSAHAMTLRRS